jgi:hypothetical protein
MEKHLLEFASISALILIVRNKPYISHKLVLFWVLFLWGKAKNKSWSIVRFIYHKISTLPFPFGSTSIEFRASSSQGRYSTT